MTISLEERDIRRIVQEVINIFTGRQNNVGKVTLTTGATTTVVSFPNCAPGCHVSLSPTTANAAAALATTFIPTATVLRKSFVISHASNAQADRTFTYEVTGGG